eukprot:8056789-Pyramimonas_sp.AAC.1
MMVSGMIQDGQDATVMLIRGVEVPGTVLWQGSGLQGWRSHVDSRRENPKNCCLARLRHLKRLSSNG